MENNQNSGKVPNRNYKETFSIGSRIALRIFFVFLLIFSILWIISSLIYGLIFAVLALVFMLRSKYINRRLRIYYGYFKRAFISAIGCLFALFSPGLGIAIVLAYFVTDSAHRHRGFSGENVAHFLFQKCHTFYNDNKREP